jgi:hypothetical protein
VAGTGAAPGPAAGAGTWATAEAESVARVRTGLSAGDETGAGAWAGGMATLPAGASPQAMSAELGGVSGLTGAFGFGSELAELLAPPATAVIWQSMPTVLWIACRRF